MEIYQEKSRQQPSCCNSRYTWVVNSSTAVRPSKCSPGYFRRSMSVLFGLFVAFKNGSSVLPLDQTRLSIRNLLKNNAYIWHAAKGFSLLVCEQAFLFCVKSAVLSIHKPSKNWCLFYWETMIILFRYMISFYFHVTVCNQILPLNWIKSTMKDWFLQRGETFLQRTCQS